MLNMTPPCASAVVEMVGLVERHWAAGPEHRCAARQLALVAARCLDFADAAGRAAAAEVVAGLLAEPPAPGEGGAAASVGCGGDGRWEDAVAEVRSGRGVLKWQGGAAIR